MKNQKIVAVDIETTGLNFLEDEIRLISAYSDEVNMVTDDIGDLKVMLEDPNILKVFHNAIFDVSFLKENGCTVNNYTDTMIMAQVSDGRTRGLGLDRLAEDYLGVYLNKSMQDSSNWSGEITEDHRKYALRDSEITYELYKILADKIKKFEIEEVLNREIAALPALIELKTKGIRFNWPKWEQQLKIWKFDAEELKSKIEKDLGNINLNSPMQLKDALWEQGIEVENTTSDELKRHEGSSSIVKSIREYKKLNKYLSSYGDKLKTRIDSGGRIRASWWLLGAETGRMSCSQPAIQAFPREARKCFEAEEGKVFVIADYSSIEMRILAEISKDETLTRAIKEGIDLHKLTASGVFDKSIEEITDEERNISKSLNFGVSYGLTSYGLKKVLTKALNREIIMNEAEKYRQKYFETYPGILRYQEVMIKAPWIKSQGGRFWGIKGRNKPTSPAKMINYPIQSSCAEGLKETMKLLSDEIRKKDSWDLVAIVHDEIVLEVPEEESKLAAEILELLMIEGMSKIMSEDSNIPIEVDVEVKNTWG